MAQVENIGLVGPGYVTDGAQGRARLGNFRETIIGQGGGKYKEAVGRGYCFSAQTAATGVAPGTALGTTGAFTLSNPVGSGKKLIVQTLGLGLVSGTIGAGTVHICSSTSGDAVPTGTPITPRNRLVGSTNTSIAAPLTTSTITTSAAKQIGILCSLNQVVVATTATNPVDIHKDIDGEIQIMPGSSITIHATAAAGTTPLVVFSASWEEQAITG